MSRPQEQQQPTRLTIQPGSMDRSGPSGARMARLAARWIGRVSAGAAVLLIFASQVAEAQRRPVQRPPPRAAAVAPPIELGVRGGFDFTEEVGSAGGLLRIPVVPAVLAVPSGDTFLDAAATRWQLNLDVILRPPALGGLYGGVGIAFLNRVFEPDEERETRRGLNLVAGLRGVRLTETNLTPYAEARWTRVSGHEPFRLVAGLDLPVSR